jgi:hypothetical protein
MDFLSVTQLKPNFTKIVAKVLNVDRGNTNIRISTDNRVFIDLISIRVTLLDFDCVKLSMSVDKASIKI